MRPTYPQGDSPARNALADMLRELRAEYALAVCGVCGEPIYAKFRYPDPRSLSDDHTIARSRLGALRDFPENHQPAHLGCNRDKSNRLPTVEEAAALAYRLSLSRRVAPRGRGRLRRI